MVGSDSLLAFLRKVGRSVNHGVLVNGVGFLRKCQKGIPTNAFALFTKIDNGVGVYRRYFINPNDFVMYAMDSRDNDGIEFLDRKAVF